MPLLPIFLKLKGRRCLVVGGGRIAESKIESLLQAGAAVAVVAPDITAAVENWVAAKRLIWVARAFEPRDLDGIFLVIAATNIPSVNRFVSQLAGERSILCNAVDDPEYCDFYYGAVVRRGPLQIAISTNGLSPVLAQRLRHELEQQFGPEYESWLEYLGAMRDLIRESTQDEQQRKKQLHELVSPEAFQEFVESQKTLVRERA